MLHWLLELRLLTELAELAKELAFGLTRNCRATHEDDHEQGLIHLLSF